MALFGFGKKKEQASKTPEAAPAEKKTQEVKPVEMKEEPVIVPEEKADPAAAEEYFQKFETLAKEDNTEAFVYLQKAADLWHERAVGRVIDLYATGHCLGCTRRPAMKVVAKEWKNPEKAIAYGLEAEERGVDVAWRLMNTCLATEDYEQALHWYEKAAEQGHVKAQFICGKMYDDGEGTATNREKALYWYEKAAEQGDAKAQLEVGKHYLFEMDMEKSFYWCQKAAEQGDADAQYIIGLHYAFGEGVAKDNHSAVRWFRAAAEQGNENAKVLAGLMEKKEISGVKIVDLVPELHKALDNYSKSHEGYIFLYNLYLSHFYPLDLQIKVLDMLVETNDRVFERKSVNTDLL